ncbi:MAG: phosphoenolpyruvate--protein phosphotransferase [Christensenellaceae bacterium]|nr:phosphoenolpyruvate--protein phosphotransferase [Christensenellaceae bacterium]
MKKIEGRGVSSGCVVAPVYPYVPCLYTAEDTPAAESAEQAMERLQTAMDTARAELEQLYERLAETDKQNAAIFLAHIELLEDEAIAEDVAMSIEDGMNVEFAVQTVCDMYAAQLEKVEDPIIRERAADLRDVKNRLLRCLAGKAEQNLSVLEKQCIIVAKDLFPADTASMDRSKVLAIVTEEGSETSHSAILARGFGIPAVVGAAGLMEQVTADCLLAVDGSTGQLLLDPDEETCQSYRQKQEAYLKGKQADEAYLGAACATADGVRIETHLNIAAAGGAELDYAPYADGVGLFRSEFLYMNRTVLPSEEEQFAAYKSVLEHFKGKPVILRTLDIGGDKQVDCLPVRQEQNPFLGIRALRLCFENLPLFRTQLRAALRAAAYGDLWLMLPMVGSIEEIRKAKAILVEERVALYGQREEDAPPMKVGIMVEIPSIALCADMAAKEVDFASIGTNDLTQYLMAADRVDAAASAYCHKYHPALFRLIRTVAEAFAAAGKPLSVCGELGGDVLGAPVLVGLGLRKLSMGGSALAGQKRRLAGFTLAQLQQLAAKVCACATAAEAEEEMKKAILI